MEYIFHCEMFFVRPKHTRLSKWFKKKNTKTWKTNVHISMNETKTWVCFIHLCLIILAVNFDLWFHQHYNFIWKRLFEIPFFVIYSKPKHTLLYRSSSQIDLCTGGWGRCIFFATFWTAVKHDGVFVWNLSIYDAIRQFICMLKHKSKSKIQCGRVRLW